MGASNSRPEPVVEQLTEGGENARISYGVSTIREENMKESSAFAAVPDLDNLTSFFGVYDGDESYISTDDVRGVEVALLCATQFHNELRDHPSYEHDLYGAMKMTFYRMDELLQLSDEWKKLLPRAATSSLIQRLFCKACICACRWPFTQPPPYIPPQETGSAACVAVIRDYEIIIGNAGHSRCIISRNGQAIQLTTDPEWDERWRIERGIGYFAFKNNKDLNDQHQMVTCDPELTAMHITNDIEFLVIVSEDIWVCLTSQGVVDFIHSQLAAGTTCLGTICSRLCDHCDQTAAGFNLTAILVQFVDAPPPEPEENLSGDNGNRAESGDNGNNNNGAPPQAPEENLSGGNGNNSYCAPSAALEEQEEHEDYEQPEGRENQPLLTSHEITEE